jgi:ABC-type transporter Mla MlaB component
VSWTLERETGRARVVLTDTVDVFEARGLHRALVMLAPLAVPIHVDLARCRDLDSSILQLLLALRRARDTAGHALVLEGVAGRVEQLVTRFMPPGAGPNSPEERPR